MPDRVFGHIPGYSEGSRFEARAEFSEAGVHRTLIAGISGSEREGVDSIVLSGGYEDDEDLGDENGWPLEFFAGELFLKCQEGSPFETIREVRIRSLFNRRSGAIYAAIAITAEEPVDQGAA